MPPKVSPLSLKSCFLEIKYKDKLVATGTGFLAKGKNRDILFSARHNFTGRNNDTGKSLSPTGVIPDGITVRFNGVSSDPTKGNIARYYDNFSICSDEMPLWIEHPRLSGRADIAAIPLPYSDEIKLFSYDIKRDDSITIDKLGSNHFDINQGNLPIRVRVADSIKVIGYPFNLKVGGFLPIWMSGFVASEPDFDVDDLPVMLIDCRARRGQSGSPVAIVSNSGTVPLMDGSRVTFSGPASSFIGMYSGRVNDESDLGKVWKPSAIQSIIDVID